MHFAHDAGLLQMTAVLYAHDAKHLLIDAHSERKMGLAPFLTLISLCQALAQAGLGLVAQC